MIGLLRLLRILVALVLDFLFFFFTFLLGLEGGSLSSLRAVVVVSTVAVDNTSSSSEEAYLTVFMDRPLRRGAALEEVFFVVLVFLAALDLEDLVVLRGAMVNER